MLQHRKWIVEELRALREVGCSFDTDRQLIARCRDAIQTDADRTTVNTWVDAMLESKELGHDHRERECRRRLNEFLERRCLGR